MSNQKREMANGNAKWKTRCGKLEMGIQKGKCEMENMKWEMRNGNEK